MLPTGAPALAARVNGTVAKARGGLAGLNMNLLLTVNGPATCYTAAFAFGSAAAPAAPPAPNPAGHWKFTAAFACDRNP
jgi:hypothetical protein